MRAKTSKQCGDGFGRSAWAAAIVILCGSVGLSQDQEPIEALLDSLLSVKVSSASRHDQMAAQAPASVSIVSSTDIERYGYRSIAEALASVRGFFTTYDHNYTYVGVRGFGRPGDYNNRILLLLNGHRLNENFYGSTYVGYESAVNMESVDRIEIVRGPGSALYGTGAMFALINVVTKRGIELDGAGASVESGSFGRLTGRFILGGGDQEGLEYALSGHVGRIKGANLRFPQIGEDGMGDGIARGRDWEEFLQVHGTVSWNGLEVSGMHADRSKGIPTGSFGTVFNDPRAQTIDTRTFLEAKYRGAVSYDASLSASMFVDRYAYDGKYPYELLFLDATRGVWIGSELQFTWDASTTHRLIAGFEAVDHSRSDYRAWDADGVYFDSNFPYRTFSAFLHDEYRLAPEVSLTIGGRWDYHSRTEQAVTPRIALLYNPSRWEVFKLLAGESYRAPSMYELYYYDAATGFASNPALRPERIQTLEASWESRWGNNAQSIVSVFGSRVRNLVDQTFDPVDSLLRFQNRVDVVARGIEWEIRAWPTADWDVSLNHSYNVVFDASGPLTNSPRNVLRGGTSFEIVRSLRTGLEARYESSRITLAGGSTGSSLVGNVFLRFKSSGRGRSSADWLTNRFSVSLRITNVFNADYGHAGSFEHFQDIIPQDRRQFSVTISAEI